MADTTHTNNPTNATANPSPTPTIEDSTSQLPTIEETLDEELLEGEIEEELIIEDFTIDGICGVY